jgi:hypothetical protein
MVTKGGAMKVDLVFACPEERGELDAALGGENALSALYAFDQRIRSILKHEDHPEAVQDALEKLRAELYEICEEYHVRFNDA